MDIYRNLAAIGSPPQWQLLTSPDEAFAALRSCVDSKLVQRTETHGGVVLYTYNAGDVTRLKLKVEPGGGEAALDEQYREALRYFQEKDEGLLGELGDD